MKTTWWIIVLGVITFSLGWTSHVLKDNLTQAEPQHRGDRYRGSMRLGPTIGSVTHYLDELDLSKEQHEQFSRLVEDATAEVQKQERGTRLCLQDTKLAIRDLLTVEQRQTLDGLIDQRWQKYRKERRERVRKWFQEETGVSAADLEEVLSAYKEYEKSWKGFRWSSNDSSLPDPEARWQRRVAAKEERNAKLAEILSDDDMKSFQEWSDRRSRGRGSNRRGRDHDHQGDKGKKKAPGA